MVDFQGFGMKIRSDILFQKWYEVGYTFSKHWYKKRVFEASMALPHPKSGQVHPLGFHTATAFILLTLCKRTGLVF